MGYISVKFTAIDMFPSPTGASFTLYTGVCGSNAELYTAPTVQADHYTLPVGTEVTVWTSIGGWYYVVTESGRAGYIRKPFVSITGSYEHNGAAYIPNAAPKPRFISSADERPIRPAPIGKIIK